jgi:predicted nucleic acid-binding protein
MAEAVKRWLLDASVFIASKDPSDIHRPTAVALLTGRDSLATLDLAGYEAANVAIRSWKDLDAALDLIELIESVRGEGVVRVDRALLIDAGRLADERGLSVYDAAYVVAARSLGVQLVSCDFRDLVSAGLAVLPADALAGMPGDEGDGPRTPGTGAT